MDRYVLAAFDLLIVTSNNELVFRGDINSELLPIRDHVENFYFKSLTDQPDPSGSLSQNEPIGLTIVGDFARVDGSTCQLVDHSQLQSLDLLGNLVNRVNQLFQTCRLSG